MRLKILLALATQVVTVNIFFTTSKIKQDRRFYKVATDWLTCGWTDYVCLMYSRIFYSYFFKQRFCILNK